MTIKASGLVGGSLPALVPDLTFPSSLKVQAGYSEVTGIDASGGLTTLLSLTGKYQISMLSLADLTAENITIKMTVDGVVIWNDTFAVPITTMSLIGLIIVPSTGASLVNGFQCNSSFLLELQTATDTSITFDYAVRPIL